MNVEELRIGNFVKKEDELGIVKMLSEKGFQVDDFNGITLGNSLWTNFEPIPLTEEWLLKFGFEKDQPIFKNGWIEIWKSNYDECYQLRIYRIGSDNEKKININHIHHLQNIVYDLTGKKLEIKLQ